MAQPEVILRRSLEKIASQLKYTDPEYKIAQVSTEGANFTSYLFEAIITSDGKDDLNLFAKVAATGEKLREITPMNMFHVEHIFYTEMLHEYRQLEDKYGLREEYRIKVPKVYDCTSTLYEETLVMENLSTKGYTLQDRFVSVDWEYAAAPFTELAKFHALSLALKYKKPDYFAKLLKEFTFKMDGKEDYMQIFVENAIKTALENTKEENKARLMAFIKKEFGLELFMRFLAPGDSAIIRHGDFRPSNLLSKTKEDGSVDIIPVDYQMMAGGSPIVDLFFFIFLGTDKQFREQHFVRLLDHYYSQLSAAVARLGMDPEQEYSRKNFDDDVKNTMPYGMCAALATLPLVTVDSAHAPVVNGDLDFSSFQALMTHNVFADRLNGIIEDFIQWGIL